ncbi:hypothetical protein [Tardiphaga sp.]|jgi:hypothetical protein|uniref:hypothetical protein n=1 Tax=Tardiphaga sp. TaxID=1926292 RepID=UPI0037DA6193
MLDRLRDIVLFVAGIIAVGALILAAYEGFNQRVTSAAFLGALGIACTFMLFMPKLEVFKVWGFEARLVKTLDEAKEILEKLRRLAVINAKSTYEAVGIGQRWDASSAVENQARLDEINIQLVDFGVPEAERRSLAKKYVRLMGFDMYMHYVQTLDRYFGFKANALRMQGNRENNDDMKAEATRYEEMKQSWKPNYNLFSKLDTYSLEEELGLATPTKQLNEADKKGIEIFKGQLLRLYKDSEVRAGLTKEAAVYLDTYRGIGGPDKRIIELFGFNPSEVR